MLQYNLALFAGIGGLKSLTSLNLSGTWDCAMKLQSLPDSNALMMFQFNSLNCSLPEHLLIASVGADLSILQASGTAQPFKN